MYQAPLMYTKPTSSILVLSNSSTITRRKDIGLIDLIIKGVGIGCSSTYFKYMLKPFNSRKDSFSCTNFSKSNRKKEP